MKLVFLGLQGSGKSTQAARLATKLNLPLIEMGQLLRERGQGQDQSAIQIKKALEVGDLVPDNLTIKTLAEKLSKPDYASGYVLDGYPRNFAQLEALDKDIDRVFYIMVSDQEAIKRLLKRGRVDDSLKVLTRRLNLYHQETEPLLSYFKEKDNLEAIDGERSIEAIEEEIAQKISDGKK